MIRQISALSVVLVIIMGHTGMATTRRLERLGEIRGSSFLAIQSAITALRRGSPDLAQTTIEVVRDGDSQIVILDDQSVPSGPHGISALRLEPRAQLSAPDVVALRSRIAQTQLLDRIQGHNFRAIEVAMQEFRARYSPDLDDYNIKVLRKGESGDSLVVIILDKVRPRGSRGSVGEPGFEVELNSRDLRVLRANFIR
jgi:hypothetical protein